MTVYVYIIAHLDGEKPRSPVKIGISANPDKRLRALATASPYRLVLLSTFATPGREFAALLEGAFHEVMIEKRMAGEWFDIHPAYAVWLMCHNFRGALENYLGDDPELLAQSVEASGLAENERLVAKLDAHIKGGLH